MAFLAAVFVLEIPVRKSEVDSAGVCILPYLDLWGSGINSRVNKNGAS
jgi:hypothetical protein